MKSVCPKRLRIARIAALVSVMFLLGTSFSGCRDSKKQVNDDVNLTVVEEGDLITGKPYRIRADRRLQDLQAEHGELMTVNPVTGESAGENEWFYALPEEYFTSYELNYDGDSDGADSDGNSSGNEAENNSLKAFTETFRITLGDGAVQEVKQTFAVTDPLFPDQWHLYNIGQNPYGVTNPPLKKTDLNVIPAWRMILPEEKRQIDGSGVYVAVWDSPVDLNHEDLRDRIYDPGIPGSADIVNTGITLEDLKQDPYRFHGTAVAGIIAASAGNQLGGRGVAFNARVTSFFYNADDALDLETMLKMDHLNLVNASIGYTLYTWDLPAVWDLCEALYEKNIAVIHAQGNEFNAFYDENYKPYSESNCLAAEWADCEFMQTDPKDRYPFHINVGALNAQGAKASYSSTGANLWVTGFGGEYGAFVSHPEWSFGATIVTTLSSYDPGDFGDPDEDSPWRTADNKYYTNKVMGASAAAPSVSGAAALSYQAKPDMTVSQLRYLLAKTARNDTKLPTLALTPQDVYDDIYQEIIVYDCGWQDNAAGFRFSNWYGFGVIDAGALVKAALECDKDPVCAGMAELPEMYVSSGKNPCAYTDDSRRLITCSFSDFQNEDGEPLGQTEITLDAVTYDVSGLSYLPEGIIEACELAASDEDAEVTEHNIARKHAVFKANVLLELIAESASGTRSLLKPVYTNWDYHSGFNVPEYYDDFKEVKSAEGTAPESLEIAASAFYQESLKEDPENKFRMSIKSPCQIDLDRLNKNMHLTVWGRRK